MSALLRRPKLLVAIVALGVAVIVGLAGGALGNEFGGGFLGSPIANLQLAAEDVTPNELFLGWSITNTMLATWLTILVLAVLSFLATRRMKEVPTGLQNFFEAFIEFFVDLAESVAGPKQARRFLPLVMTIFMFIVAANWLGILPGFGTIGRVETPEEVVHHSEEDDEEVDLSTIKLHLFDGDGAVAIQSFGSVDEEKGFISADKLSAEELETGKLAGGKRAGLLAPFLRSANTDVNMTLAIALVAMTMIQWWGLRTLGVFSHLGKFFNVKQGPIWFFVGILEFVSEIARIISFTFRLFGNIFAGEVLLVAMAFLVPLVGIIPFLGLELFVGAIQAFIFAMLTLVFAATATALHGAEEH